MKKVILFCLVNSSILLLPIEATQKCHTGSLKKLRVNQSSCQEKKEQPQALEIKNFPQNLNRILLNAITTAKGMNPEIYNIMQVYLKQDVNHEFTELMCAVIENDPPLVAKLLDRNPNIEMQDDQGRTALTFATIFGHTVIIKQLLQHGACTEVRDKANKTALDYARINGLLDLFIPYVSKLFGFQPASAPLDKQEEDSENELDECKQASLKKTIPTLTTSSTSGRLPTIKEEKPRMLKRQNAFIQSSTK